MSVAIVVPTIGRPSLRRLLDSLCRSAGPRFDALVIVDDRPGDRPPLELTGHAPWLAGRLTVPRSGGYGPAAARNVGWRSVRADWVVFLDDDVQVSADWLADLAADLASAEPDVAGVQGRVAVPLPGWRRPTDWERGTACLASGKWITADMAYRRSALAEAGGFDERFRRAFREDSDLALRVGGAGHVLAAGRRQINHPVRLAPWDASLRQQRGNADDALMRRLHGPGWYERAEAPVGRRVRHLLITGCAVAAACGAAGRRKAALVAGAGWVLGTAEFACARIRPGPRDRDELARMLATSLAIPPAAVWYRARGAVRHRHATTWGARPPVAAVLVDRDGTIVHDVPYNGDPELVAPMPAAREALDRLRAAGLPVGVISNQSGIGRGLIDERQLAAVNARVEQLLGPFAVWQVCPHLKSDRCACRKPRPGLLIAAAQALRIPVDRCAVIGDIGSDVQAARAVGAIGVLVPTAQTRRAELAAASIVRPTLGAAVDYLLSDRGGPRR